MGPLDQQVYPAPEDGGRRRNHARLPSRRRESLRTTLWFVPAVLVAVAALAFLVTYTLDQAAYHGTMALPWWIRTGSADAGRQILTAIAAAVITVVGVVFSITILALTLASQQFGPRMLRNFIRDRGTQFTLGAFVATFVYAVMALGSITNGRRGEFVPHISITVALVLMVADMGVLIYFIHHIAESIQLPEVIAGIAADLSRAIDAEFPDSGMQTDAEPHNGPPVEELVAHIRDEGVPVPATESGYLQFVGYAELAAIAEVSVAMVLDAAVVSAAPLSFLLHAATAMAATARVATFNRVVIIVRLLPVKKRTALIIEAVSTFNREIEAKTVHASILPIGIPPSPTPCPLNV